MKTSSGKLALVLFIAAAFCTPAALAAPIPASKSQPAPQPAAKKAKKNDDDALILERANRNENIYDSRTGEFVSNLSGNVVFRYDDIRIRSDEATWRKNRGIVDFRKNVKVEQAGQTMTCERLNFVRDNNLLSASGKIFYIDSAMITTISGNSAEYNTNTKEAMLWGNPVLTRRDSTAADTLFIRGRIMKYNDSTKVATVTDNVNIRKGELAATCRKADYFSKTDIALLRLNPIINYEKHRVVGDSIDLFFGKETLKSAQVMGRAHGHYKEIADSTSDTTVTNIYSDSLYLSMYESGKMELMKAFGNARGDFSETSAKSGSATTTNLVSDSMHLYMFETGKISAMKAFGSARGDISETAAQTGNVTTTNLTSDSLQMFMFETGKMRAMKAFGSARGRYTETAPRTGNAMSTVLTSDSLHLYAYQTTGKMRAMMAFGSAHGRSSEWATSSKDTAITHIWSDSLRVRISEAGKIRSMTALGRVRSLNFALADSAARANEVTGQAMTLTFNASGQIESALVKGDAKSIYYIEESDGGGSNRAGGDQILVSFSNGKAQRLRVRGKANGIYFP
jgi:lipopolysaccharide export system protein LptA